MRQTAFFSWSTDLNLADDLADFWSNSKERHTLPCSKTKQTHVSCILHNAQSRRWCEKHVKNSPGCHNTPAKRKNGREDKFFNSTHCTSILLQLDVISVSHCSWMLSSNPCKKGKKCMQRQEHLP